MARVEGNVIATKFNMVPGTLAAGRAAGLRRYDKRKKTKSFLSECYTITSKASDVRHLHRTRHLITAPHRVKKDIL